MVAFNLINDENIEETEARIAAFRAENAAIVARNAERDEAYAQQLKEQEAEERQSMNNERYEASHSRRKYGTRCKAEQEGKIMEWNT